MDHRRGLGVPSVRVPVLEGDMLAVQLLILHSIQGSTHAPIIKLAHVALLQFLQVLLILIFVSIFQIIDIVTFKSVYYAMNFVLCIDLSYHVITMLIGIIQL